MTNSATHRLASVLEMMGEGTDTTVYPSEFVSVFTEAPEIEKPLILCIVCGDETGKKRRSAKYCSTCLASRQSDSARRWQCKYPLALKAHGLVTKAIKEGVLPPLLHLDCVDCGAPARHYDHRDYHKPLEVDPVCMKCNYRRGPAEPYIKT